MFVIFNTFPKVLKNIFSLCHYKVMVHRLMGQNALFFHFKNNYSKIKCAKNEGF